MLRFATRFGYNNLRTFTDLEVLNSHLARHRYSHLMVYFRSSWNPECDVADQHVNRFASQNRHVEVIKIDSDVSPKIVNHYSVRSEPEFVFCMFGDEVIRQIGPNYKGLEEKLDKMVKLSEEDNDFMEMGERWVPYGTRFERYYNQTLKPLYGRNVSDF